jgi:hypothetical protein
MRLTIIGEDFRLYGVNFKGLFSPTTPPSIYKPYDGFSLVDRAFIDSSNITDS